MATQYLVKTTINRCCLTANDGDILSRNHFKIENILKSELVYLNRVLFLTLVISHDLIPDQQKGKYSLVGQKKMPCNSKTSSFNRLHNVHIYKKPEFSFMTSRRMFNLSLSFVFSSLSHLSTLFLKTKQKYTGIRWFPPGVRRFQISWLLFRIRPV